MSLWGNCIERCRHWVKFSGEELNFVQFTDSLVVYDTDPERLLACIEDLYGSAVAWGVPIRGGIAYGELVHIENSQRPGTAMNLGGLGLVKAYDAEGISSGSGMRLFLTAETLALLKCGMQKFRPFEQAYEFKWWLNAFNTPLQFEQCASCWWGEFNGLKQKSVGQWFTGKNREATKNLFDQAIIELIPERSTS